MNVIDQQFQEIERLLTRANSERPTVSAWSMYQQLEHILLANAGIATMIEHNQEPTEIRSRTLIGYVVLTLGQIPRGAAKSPTEVVPTGLSQTELVALCQATRTRYQQVDLTRVNSSDRVVGNHPYFGGLTAKQWLRFVEVHTRHHLKIIRDILT